MKVLYKIIYCDQVKFLYYQVRRYITCNKYFFVQYYIVYFVSENFFLAFYGVFMLILQYSLFLILCLIHISCSF